MASRGWKGRSHDEDSRNGAFDTRISGRSSPDGRGWDCTARSVRLRGGGEGRRRGRGSEGAPEELRQGCRRRLCHPRRFASARGRRPARRVEGDARSSRRRARREVSPRASMWPGASSRETGSRGIRRRPSSCWLNRATVAFPPRASGSGPCTPKDRTRPRTSARRPSGSQRRATARWVRVARPSPECSSMGAASNGTWPARRSSTSRPAAWETPKGAPSSPFCSEPDRASQRMQRRALPLPRRRATVALLSGATSSVSRISWVKDWPRISPRPRVSTGRPATESWAWRATGWGCWQRTVSVCRAMCPRRPPTSRRRARVGPVPDASNSGCSRSLARVWLGTPHGPLLSTGTGAPGVIRAAACSLLASWTRAL